MVPEAQLKDTDTGLVPASAGWFVMNAREARWFAKPGRGHSLPLTGHDEYEAETFFPMLGVALRVVGPGEPSTTYHWETEQEDFLVLSGEALVLIEGQERRVKQWDFVHCPPEARHAFVGAGDGPACSCASARDNSRRTGRGGAAAQTRRPPDTVRAPRRTLRTTKWPTPVPSLAAPSAIAMVCCRSSGVVGCV